MNTWLDKLVYAIAVQEGFFTVGTLPNRLNNPGDLEFAGQLNATAHPVPGRTTPYAEFISAQAGITALYRQVWVFVALGITLRQLITRWAPPNENDTQAYLRNVIRLSGISSPDTPLLLLVKLAQ